MFKHILKKTLIAIATIWLIITISFTLVHTMPGDPIIFLIGEEEYYYLLDNNPAYLEQVTEKFGLNDDLPTQYARYMKSVLTLDFGLSYTNQKPVIENFRSAAYWTLLLSVPTLIISLKISCPKSFVPSRCSALGLRYAVPSSEGSYGAMKSAKIAIRQNDLGQDIFSEMVYGTRVSLLLGVFSALLVSLIGTALALIAGYFGGTADKTICAVIDVAMAVPSLPLTMLLIAYLKSGMFSLILAISITAWTGTARILRTRVKQICELPYIKIEKAMGVSAPVIMVRHILPNLKDILLTRMALSVSGAMTTESGLSFLGLGTYGQKSWGNILHFAFFRNSILRKQIWWYLPPIICISVAVMGFMLVGYYGRQRRE